MYFTYYNRPRRRWALLNATSGLIEAYASIVTMRDVRVTRAGQYHRREGFLGTISLAAGVEYHGGHEALSGVDASGRRAHERALRSSQAGARRPYIKRMLRLQGRQITDDLGCEVCAAKFLFARAPTTPEAPPLIHAVGTTFRAPPPGGGEVLPVDWAAVPETQRAHGQCRHCGDPATYMRLRYRAGQLRGNSMAQYDALCGWHAGNVLAHAEAS